VKLDTRAIAVAIAFAAVTVVLNPAFSGFAVPAPFLPYLSYYIWEIPITAAFFLIGPKYGISIVFLNALTLMVAFPGSSFIHPPFSIISGSSMLLGAYLGYRLVVRGVRENAAVPWTKLTTYATGLGILFRVVVMTFVNYVALHYLSKAMVGVELQEAGIIAVLPLVVLFNITIALYTIPIGCAIAKIISKNLRMNINIRRL
jgi:riboflavin transporter FmnP